jgi:sugar lactone lactonase YvrE
MNLCKFIRLTVVGLAFCVPTQVRAGLLYVSSESTGVIETITPGGTNSVFASGLTTPCYMAFDSAGNLYVANDLGGGIDKITPGGAISVFASGLSQPVGLAFDASGNLYVSNAAGTTIDKITPGGAVSLFATGLMYQYGLAVDSKGNVYAADPVYGVIEKFTPGGVGSTFAAVAGATALAFGASGNLYTSGDSDTITKITSGGVESVFATGLNRVGNYGLAFDSSGNLFSANVGTNTITEFTPGGVGSGFSTAVPGPFGLVFGPTSAVPEPSSFLTMCSGLGVLGAILRLRRRHRLVNDDRQQLKGFRIL